MVAACGRFRARADCSAVLLYPGFGSFGTFGTFDSLSPHASFLPTLADSKFPHAATIAELRDTAELWTLL